MSQADDEARMEDERSLQEAMGDVDGKGLRDRLGDKKEWRFKRGKRFWGFYLMLGALALYLAIEYVVRPAVS